jgi:hypothetical protein
MGKERGETTIDGNLAVRIDTKCSENGGVHKPAYVKNCIDLPPDHPDFLHCPSCGAIRCSCCDKILIS